MSTDEPKIYEYEPEESKSPLRESQNPITVAEKGLVPEPVKLALIFLLILAVSYLIYDKYKTGNERKAEIAELMSRIEKLEISQNVSEAAFASRVSDLESDLEQAVGSTKETIERTAAQLQAEGKKTRQELTQVISSRTDDLENRVRAARAETDAKITQVNTAVGGVKTEVGDVKEDVVTVKTDLANTRKDLEGTRRQLVDVRDTLTAAVAKNSTELAQLRLKGERDYYEFTIPDKKGFLKVGDIRLQLTKTDVKKGKYNLKVLVDDKSLEKKDRQINEPLQFLVGQERLRYEVVVNWVQKDSAGGYLSIPKDKTLSSERP
jgi:predicted  nucleic acid-binding Zn-ribbon protein